MQHETSTPSTDVTAPKGSTPAAMAKRSLHLNRLGERPRQHSVMQKQSRPLVLASGDAPCVPGASDGASDGALHRTEKESTKSAAHSQAMSWLPFPAMNADVSWNELADTDDDDDDRGWNLDPLKCDVNEDTTPVHDPLFHNDGTVAVSGPLIPSFSGELLGARNVTTAFVEGSQCDLSTASLGRLESPTPVTVIQDLSCGPSRTQFGFTLGSTMSSKATLDDADGFLDAAAADGVSAAGSNCQWERLHIDSRHSLPELVVEARLEAVNPVGSDERVVKMIEEAKKGLAAGCEPTALREGTGGTYFLSDAVGRNVGIFKPCDEEPLAPNNPKGWNSRSMSDPGMKPSVRVGEAALREVAAFLLDHDGFAGVPPACLVAVSHQKLNYAARPASKLPSSANYVASSVSPMPAMPSLNGLVPHAHESLHTSESSDVLTDSPVATPADSRLTAPAVPGGVKLGSLQAFAEHSCDANDIASSRFSADSIHRVGILDIRLLNLDRHAGNLLVAEAPRCGSAHAGPGPLHKLIPIDHGFALPEALDDPYFEWQYWPQASVPFSPEVKAYVEALDGPADVAMLQHELPALRPECLRCLLVTTTVLKRCVAANMTLAEIGGIFTRAKASEASDFEAICMDAREDALAYSTLPSLPSLTLSDLPVVARDCTSGLHSACVGPFPYDEASSELSPRSSLAMSGLLGNSLIGGSVSCETSPFKPLPADLVSELPLKNIDQFAAESPCMVAAAAIQCGTPALSSTLPAIPSTPSWLCTADMGIGEDDSPHSPKLIMPCSVVFHGPDIRRSEQGMSMGAFGCHHSARTNVSSRTVWRSKRCGRSGANLPNLLSAVHPDKANYVFSGLSDEKWSVFFSRVEDFVDEELSKGTWNDPECAGPVAGSCPEPVKSRKF